MKQNLTITVVVACLSAVVAVRAMADEHEGKMIRGHMVKSGDGSCCKREGMHDAMPMKRGGGVKREIIATEDGGLVVAVGNLLIKYDKKLKLVNKTQLDITEDDMQQMVEHMKMMHKQCGACKTGKQECPMCRKVDGRCEKCRKKQSDTETDG